MAEEVVDVPPEAINAVETKEAPLSGSTHSQAISSEGNENSSPSVPSADPPPGEKGEVPAEPPQDATKESEGVVNDGAEDRPLDGLNKSTKDTAEDSVTSLSVSAGMGLQRKLSVANEEETAHNDHEHEGPQDEGNEWDNEFADAANELTKSHVKQIHDEGVLGSCSMVVDDPHVFWVTNEKTTLCSERCAKIVNSVCGLAQKSVWDLSGAVVARTLEQLCEECRHKTTKAVISVKRFLRAAIFYQLLFRWRQQYRRILIERSKLYGGVNLKVAQEQLNHTKGMCTRCVPFLEILERRIAAFETSFASQKAAIKSKGSKSSVSSGASTPSNASPFSPPEATGGLGILAPKKIKRKETGNGPLKGKVLPPTSVVELKKRFVVKCMRLAFFMCSRCKERARIQIKQVSQKK